MEGLNLSSSLEKKQQKSAFFSGSLVVILLFAFFLAIWGGMQWYSKKLNDTVVKNTTLLDGYSSQLKGDKVDRIAFLDTRLEIAKKQMSNFTDSEKLLTQLENLVISNVQLTRYEFNKKENFVIIGGETDNFKYVAQQLANFKQEDLFIKMNVESLKKNEGGRILFVFKTNF